MCMAGAFMTTLILTGCRNYEKAKENYQRVLVIEPQHPQGLGFLGMVYHFQDQVDMAIVKYHEVRLQCRCCSSTEL